MSVTPFEQALQSLPHGLEFRFVDELTVLEPGQKVSALYRLRGEAEFFKGHFPEQPILPAVLMIEAIAQAGGIAAQTDPKIPAMKNVRLTAVRQVKIYGTAFPEDVIQIESSVQGRMANLILIQGQVRLGEQILAEGQITLSGELEAS